MLTQGNEKSLGIIFQNSDPEQSVSDKLQILEQYPWYTNIIFFLCNLTCRDHLLGHKRRELRLKATKYCLTKDGLGWRNPNGLIHVSMNLSPKNSWLSSIQDFVVDILQQEQPLIKSLEQDTIGRTLFLDVRKSVKVFPQCQLFTEKQQMRALPLNPIVFQAPFQ